MGTNYYHRTNICEHCNRYNEHHIGKSSGGWTFSFHGERNPESNSLGGVVISFSDWKSRLRKGKIFDEYGDEISFNEFIELVEMKKDEKNNQTKHCRVSHPAYAKENCWLDEDGNSFSEGEFS
jgi:hypothetical protein